VHPVQLTLLLGRELGLASPQFALRLGDGHPLTGAHPNQVDLELGERREDVEEHLPVGAGSSVVGF
jgi:hypothetical protein